MSTVPISTEKDPVDPPPAEEKTLMRSIIPEEYHDRGYLKDFLDQEVTTESHAAVYKKLDESQKLLGKKSGVPEAGAPAEEWEAFYKTVRPETVDGYEFKQEEGQTPDADFDKVIRDAFHKRGLSKTQAEGIYADMRAAIAPQAAANATKLAEQTAENKRLDEEFDVLVKETFKEGSEAALKRASGLLKEFTPENLQSHIGNLDNKAMTIMAGVVNAIALKYMSEDELDNPGGKSADLATQTTMRAKARELMAKPEYSDKFHPQHQAVYDEVQQIYADLSKKP